MILRAPVLILKHVGLDFRRFIYSCRGLFAYLKDLIRIKKQIKDSPEFSGMLKIFPIMNDRYELSGEMSGHYFHQDLYVARRIYNNKPIKHVDIGSSVYGFVSHVAVFREIEYIDIRDSDDVVRNIIIKKADVTSDELSLSNYCDSVSSLHAIEHFGLGRYGDPIDLNGHIKAINNIYRMLKEDGVFYLSVPIGHMRIEFNAHRVFSVNYLFNILSEKFFIDKFSYIDDNGRFYEDVEINQDKIKENYGCSYGCGIFEMKKA
ncbi:MAG: DUF268 domain-containing protein [Gammaproteobacteria bacterium]|nr:DUF268 domain-containing protein [Gammaproteobacteria bacterium]